MRSLVALTVLWMTVISWASPATTPFKLMMAKLLQRCEDGVAVACYSYGQNLIKDGNEKEKKHGEFYVRRACTLAYAPACQQRTTASTAKVIKEQKGCRPKDLNKTITILEGQLVSQVTIGSMWDKAGIRAGDILRADMLAIHKSLDEQGAAVANVQRGNENLSLIMNCPSRKSSPTPPQ